uniref:Alpha-1,6-mannosyl-glycoprotein 4-beta-N-acetylglucosaminyltransferase-like n=1 Tax=Erpetoichthys calabaricus TaxID=27687 RepID=A0A8C4RVV2_ERPCA
MVKNIRFVIAWLCRRSTIAALFLGLVILLTYIHIKPSPLEETPSMQQTVDFHWQKVHSHHQSTPQEKNIFIPQKKENLHFSTKEDVLEPLKIPYNILLGSLPPSSQKKYLSIGISSVKRNKENYLMDTIESVFKQLSPQEQDEMVLVVFLANFDSSVNIQTAKEISSKFQEHVDSHRLIVISCSKELYPSFEGLKQNFNDPEDRVKYRSKQNVDYAFLANFCTVLSQYYLILEDDVYCSKNFLTSIKKHVSGLQGPWATITFSKLGYIGKLYHSEDLPKLARFLLMFYDEMPCDWLLEHFHQSKAQKEMIRFKPSLFQHVGSFSSFHDTPNKLKDDEFQEFYGETGDNPPAVLRTDITIYEENLPQKCYDGTGYFWGKTLMPGNYVLLIFSQSVQLQKVRIVTGSLEHKTDILQSGYAEIGWELVGENDQRTCKTFVSIGDFKEGKLEVNDLDKNIPNKVDCLNVKVKGSQIEWLLISKIDVWLAHS